MPGNQKKTNWAKCKVWTPTMIMEMEGPRMACAIQLFELLPIESQEVALLRMGEILEKRKAESPQAAITPTPAEVST